MKLTRTACLLRVVVESYAFWNVTEVAGCRLSVTSGLSVMDTEQRLPGRVSGAASRGLMGAPSEASLRYQPMGEP
jgi:hypothetical protein